jgi:hypothetical protein
MTYLETLQESLARVSALIAEAEAEPFVDASHDGISEQYGAYVDRLYKRQEQLRELINYYDPVSRNLRVWS